MKATRILWRGGVLLAAAAVVAACSDSTGPATRTVSLSVAGVLPPGVAPSVSGAMSLRMQAAGDSLVLVSGTDTLVITSVEVLLRKVELKRVGVASCGVTESSDCQEFETGARLVDVPLIAGATSEAVVPVDTGTFSEVEFDVHKLGSDSIDQAFAAANPTWPASTSIRVTGTFNHTPFTFTTGLDAQQEITFVPPLVVGPGGASNVTIRFDISTWFRNGAGGPLVDPSTANQGGPNKSVVDNNIQNSIHAFEDDNKDGSESTG